MWPGKTHQNLLQYTSQDAWNWNFNMAIRLSLQDRRRLDRSSQGCYIPPIYPGFFRIARSVFALYRLSNMEVSRALSFPSVPLMDTLLSRILLLLYTPQFHPFQLFRCPRHTFTIFISFVYFCFLWISALALWIWDWDGKIYHTATGQPKCKAQ